MLWVKTKIWFRTMHPCDWLRQSSYWKSTTPWSSSLLTAKDESLNQAPGRGQPAWHPHAAGTELWYVLERALEGTWHMIQPHVRLVNRMLLPHDGLLSEEKKVWKQVRSDFKNLVSLEIRCKEFTSYFLCSYYKFLKGFGLITGL